jgi:tetratricopeptide (TPR) repeat protein
VSIEDLTEQAFNERINDLDEIIKGYAKLRYSIRNQSEAIQTKLALDLVQKTDLDAFQHKGRYHYMAPYIFETVKGILDDKGPAIDYSKMLFDYATNSCPKQRYIESRVSSADYVNKEIEATRRFLKDLQGMKNNQNIRTILNAYFKGAKPESIAAHSVELRGFIGRSSLLDTLLFRKMGTTFSTQFPPRTRIEALAKLDDCKASRGLFLKMISNRGSVGFKDIKESALQIESCLARTDRRERKSFWTELRNSFDKPFYSEGWIFATLRLARIHWGNDEFEVTRKYLHEINERVVNKQEKSYADSLLMRGQVVENEGDLPKAIILYQDFIEQFPLHEDVNVAVSSLIVINAGLGQWDQVLKFGKVLIQKEEEKSIDRRDASQYGLALFWSSRALLELGRKEDAIPYWQTLVTECFSSYYGALGHYMFEQIKAKEFAPHPISTRTPSAPSTAWGAWRLFAATVGRPSTGSVRRSRTDTRLQTRWRRTPT